MSYSTDNDDFTHITESSDIYATYRDPIYKSGSDESDIFRFRRFSQIEAAELFNSIFTRDHSSAHSGSRKREFILSGQICF